MENTNNAGTLATPLQSAVFIKMEDSKTASIAAGNRWCKLIKKGENSKLSHSVAVEVPMLSASLLDKVTATAYPAIHAQLLATLESLENEYIKGRAVAGALSVQYSELTVESLEATATAENEASGIGQLSEERIKGWFESSLRDMWIVALADKLGIAEDASEADVRRLEQIANQTRDNLAKLASRKPVSFDERVRNALNKALSYADVEDTFAPRLVAKLNQAVGADDMLANLGM